MTKGRRLKVAPPRLKAANSRRVTPPQKRADPIYSEAQYREWREIVIARSGGVCQDPRHDPGRPRTASRLYADHIKELRDGGAPFDPSNGIALCGACHTKKTIAERQRRLKG